MTTANCLPPSPTPAFYFLEQHGQAQPNLHVAIPSSASHIHFGSEEYAPIESRIKGGRNGHMANSGRIDSGSEAAKFSIA